MANTKDMFAGPDIEYLESIVGIADDASNVLNTAWFRPKHHLSPLSAWNVDTDDLPSQAVRKPADHKKRLASVSQPGVSGYFPHADG